MLAYILRRILATIPVMAIVALIIFSLIYLDPSDPAAANAGDQATAEDIARIREAMGLNKPYFVRFGEWTWGILHGDLGKSILTKLPVAGMIAQRIEPTLSLMLITLVLAIVIAVPMGVIAAWKRGTWIDTAIMSLAVVGFSAPVFVIGYVLIYFFAAAVGTPTGPGLYAPVKGALALVREPDPAVGCARLHLYRAHRSHHARLDAGGAEPGLHPHRTRQGRRPP